MNITLPSAREDKATRTRVAVALVASLVLVPFLTREPTLAGVPGIYWAVAAMGAAMAYAWKAGMMARARAMLRLDTLRKEGQAATALLNAGDVAGAREAFLALLEKARPLGAFHAVHVLMYGVTRYCEGQTREGLDLVTRAIDSGWFDTRRATLDAALGWQALMLLDLDQVSEARKAMARASPQAVATVAVSIAMREQDWTGAVEQARAALATLALPPTTRATLATLGRSAAGQARIQVPLFDEELARNPLPEGARSSPALAPLLGGWEAGSGGPEPRG